ncbi:unnamed protein product [Cercospora beticola]|nr:unnamed protein product [Cercospora beticola]
MPTSFLQAWTLVAALLSITKAQGINGNYSAIIDDNIEDYDRDLYQYIKQNLPLRNGTEYPLRYTGFNWTEPAEDNGLWTLRWNTADAWLPGNLTKPGREKAVVTSYALQWQGEDKYNNLSAKIANNTDALRDAAIRQSPPNMCFGMMSWSSDFPEEVKKRMDVDASNGCESLFGEECLRSLTRAYTIAFDDDDCDIAVDEPRSTGLAGCADTWDKLGGLTFLSTSKLFLLSFGLLPDHELWIDKRWIYRYCERKSGVEYELQESGVGRCYCTAGPVACGR